MHATVFLSALMLGASGVTAAAIDQRNLQTFISVTFYNDVNRPNSTDPDQALTLTVSTGSTCTNFQSEPLDNRASSVTVPHGFFCNFYDDNICGGNASQSVFAPGIDNLANIGFDNLISSFRCQKAST